MLLSLDVIQNCVHGQIKIANWSQKFSNHFVHIWRVETCTRGFQNWKCNSIFKSFPTQNWSGGVSKQSDSRISSCQKCLVFIKGWPVMNRSHWNKVRDVLKKRQETNHKHSWSSLLIFSQIVSSSLKETEAITVIIWLLTKKKKKTSCYKIHYENIYLLLAPKSERTRKIMLIIQIWNYAFSWCR